MYTYITISPPSFISLPPSLSHPSRWSQSTKLISLCYAAISHQLPILHLIVYICQCHSLTSSYLTLPPTTPYPQVCSLRLHLYSCPALRFFRTFFFFFQIPYICVSVLYFFFSFSLSSLCMTDSRSIHLTTNNSISFPFMAE